jgi:DNA-binding NarL/FixJ family response regulator
VIQVYIASDYPVVRAGLRSILDGSGDCQVAGEGSLGQVVSQAGASHPDVLLLELSGSDQEGAETLVRLASESPVTGVIVLSDEAREGPAREALESGARGYLPRDVSPEEIVEAVRAVHQGLIVLHPAMVRAFLPPTRPAGPTAAGEPLTEREMEVLQLLAQGLPSKAIATRLRISEHTVKFHVGSLMGKLRAASRTEAVALAIRRGLIVL